MQTTEAGLDPINVCRACNQPTPQCLCDARRDCYDCRGRGFNCIDDLCHAQGRCMHGNQCRTCDGTGRLRPEQVLVVPDGTAAAIREYLREHPELRKDEYADEGSDADPLATLCYPAAEAYYHATGREHEIYCLSWSDVDGDLDGTHWYLRESEWPKRWIDLSLPLMPPVDLPPFEEGIHRGFITGDDPSNRAQQVLDAVEVADAE
jgi:hypothetical protein